MSEAPAPTVTPEEASAALEQLARVQGPRELHAAILALLLPRGSQRARRAWLAETPGIVGAPALREAAKAIAPDARLPFLETLLERMAGQPLEARQDLITATRRVMAARGSVRPLDRLHWLLMRKTLTRHEPPVRVGGSPELERWLESEVMAVAVMSAWLSRMVPDETRGSAWYDSVLAPWRAEHPDLPTHHLPDAEAMVIAHDALLGLGWMQRPILVRHWVSLAFQHSAQPRLPETAADALRLIGLLLDCPLPPELARQFIARPYIGA